MSAEFEVSFVPQFGGRASGFLIARFATFANPRGYFPPDPVDVAHDLDFILQTLGGFDRVERPFLLGLGGQSLQDFRPRTHAVVLLLLLLWLCNQGQLLLDGVA